MAALQFLYLVCCVSVLVVSPVCGEDDWTWSPEFYKTGRNIKKFDLRNGSRKQINCIRYIYCTIILKTSNNCYVKSTSNLIQPLS